MWLGDLGPERREWKDPRNGRVWVIARDPENAPGVLKFLELGETVEETIVARVGPGVELMRLPDERIGEILDAAL
jgi:hypothetical protein